MTTPLIGSEDNWKEENLECIFINKKTRKKARYVGCVHIPTWGNVKWDKEIYLATFNAHLIKFHMNSIESALWEKLIK